MSKFKRTQFSKQESRLGDPAKPACKIRVSWFQLVFFLTLGDKGVESEKLAVFVSGDFTRTIAYANHFVWDRPFFISPVPANQVSDNCQQSGWR